MNPVSPEQWRAGPEHPGLLLKGQLVLRTLRLHRLLGGRHRALNPPAASVRIPPCLERADDEDSGGCIYFGVLF